MAKPSRLPAIWPEPADEGAAGRLLERFAELDAPQARLLDDPAARALLRCIGGNAPYLADLALREADILPLFARSGPLPLVNRALRMVTTLPPGSPQPRVAATMRQAKRVVALVTALADIGGMWKLEQVTAALSDLAEATLGLAVRHLLRAAHNARDLRLPDPADPATGSGFIVLGMGKLGARELNYSSDIDLILLHDRDAGVYHGDEPLALYSRLAHGLVRLMEARDADGYVFRTDLRLRPDPAATPPCMAMQAAISYYESMGQNWERAAMLKARPVAGDLAAGAEFLAAIRPFVWRRHLDFAAVADIHAMKRRIDEHKGRPASADPDPVARIAGHNVKLGQGGIREVEFLVQTLQLVWGGRNPDLRNPRTLDGLRIMARAGHVPRRTATELAAAYRFLRQVEHRLQMVADRQTHTLPESRAELERFAIFMGQPDAESFARLLLAHGERVREGYQRVFGDIAAPETATQLPSLDFRGAGDLTPQTKTALEAMGYQDTARVAAGVRAWQAGRIRALRSSRARELMEQVLPHLLHTISRQPSPDAAFARFDAFLAELPAGVQLLSLFQRNPQLLDRVAAVLGASPSLANHLARTPSALEGLLAPDEQVDYGRMMRLRLADAETLEDAISIIRATVRAEEFSVSVATLEGRMDADAAGAVRADLAAQALAALLPRVLADFERRHGRVRGGAMAVVLMGKAGGREMMAGSDLDLMLIYDHPETVHESTVRKGGRAMAASQWFIRAVHAFVAALTAPDAEGPMYAVDMRLRPSGNKGPVAVSLSAFARYHGPAAEGDRAWTWERMALTRARVVAGLPALRRQVENAIRLALAGAGAPDAIRADATAMRARMLRDLPPTGPWDVKLRPGGQIEVEFIAQVLQLIHAGSHPEATSPTTRLAFERLAAAGLISPDDAATLIQADRLWRGVQGLLRITYGRGAPPQLSDSALRALARIADTKPDTPPDPGALHAAFDAQASRIRALFEHLVGKIT